MIQFINSFNEVHRQNIFYMDKTGEDLGYAMKQLLASICSDPDMILDIAAGLLVDNPSQLDQLIEADLEIMLERTDGYRIRTSKEGIEAVYNGIVIGAAPDVSLLKITEAYAEVRRSYINVKSYHRLGEKHEKRQSFFADDTSKAISNDTSGTGNVGKSRTGKIPASKKFF